MHSTGNRPDQILAFARRWDGGLPLVIVPTRYYSTPTEVFRQAGISLVIWANQTLRAAVAQMQATLREIHASRGLAGVEDRLAPLEEIFRLQGADELAAAERRYLASCRAATGAVLLAAARGEGLEAVTADRPKVMLPVAGRPLLARLVETFRRQYVQRITVVAGYKAEAVALAGVELIRNPDFQGSGELVSLACARGAIVPDTVIGYGDLLLRRYILRDLLDSPGELVVVVDSLLPPPDSRDYRDLAWCSRPDHHGLFQEDVQLLRVAARAEGGEPSGRWIGLLRARGAGRGWLLEALDRLAGRPDFGALGMPDLLNALVAAGRPVRVLYIHGHWLDVNHLEDLDRASGFTHGGTPPGEDR